MTLQLLFNREISSHWSLTTGLSFTRMKSYFEINNENTSNTRAFINRTQRINYLGIPLKANFRILDTNHFNFYTSGGILLDIVVLCWGNQESIELDGYYLYDCYPYWLDTESVSANREKNKAQWQTFINYLASKGKLTK